MVATIVMRVCQKCGYCLVAGTHDRPDFSSEICPKCRCRKHTDYDVYVDLRNGNGEP